MKYSGGFELLKESKETLMLDMQMKQKSESNANDKAGEISMNMEDDHSTATNAISISLLTSIYLSTSFVLNDQ